MPTALNSVTNDLEPKTKKVKSSTSTGKTEISYNIPLSEITYVKIEDLKKFRPLNEIAGVIPGKHHIYTRIRPSEAAVRDMKKSLRIITDNHVYYRVISPFLLWKDPTSGTTYLINGHTRTQALIELSREAPLESFHKENTEVLIELKNNDGTLSEDDASVIESILTQEVNKLKKLEQNIVFEPIPVQYLQTKSAPPSSLLLWVQKSLNGTTTKHPVVAEAESINEEWEGVYKSRIAEGSKEREAMKYATSVCCELLGITPTELSWLRTIAKGIPKCAKELLNADMIKMRTVIYAKQKHQIIVKKYPDAKVTTLEDVFMHLINSIDSTENKITQLHVDAYLRSLEACLMPKGIPGGASGGGSDTNLNDDDEEPDMSPEEEQELLSQAIKHIYDELNTVSSLAEHRDSLNDNNVSLGLGYVRSLQKVTDLFLDKISTKALTDNTKLIASILNNFATNCEELLEILNKPEIIQDSFKTSKEANRVFNKIENIKNEVSKIKNIDKNVKAATEVINVTPEKLSTEKIEFTTEGGTTLTGTIKTN